MSKKFYRAENAGRMIGGVAFDVYSIVAGTAVGVYATEDEATQKALDAIAANPANAVIQINETEYRASLAKKAPSFSNFKPSSANVPMLPTGGPLKGAGAVVVAAKSEEDEAELPVKIVGQVESVEDVLKTAVVEPPAEPESVPVQPQAVEPPPKPAKGKKH